ncbi:MAG: HlyD family secretion protein [Muribaculaceae bacterium]
MENANEIKKENKSIMAGVAIFGIVVAALCIAGLLLIKPSDEIVQGQIDGNSVRVSGKLPGRLVEVFVEEGQMVEQGDTLAHIHSSLVDAKLLQAQSMEAAASAQSQKAEGGARVEIINSAYNMWQQALAAQEITKKTYERVQNLFNEGVVSEQKRDEAQAAYNAAVAQAEAAKSQYEMAKKGAQKEDKAAAKAMQNAAKGTVDEVQALLEDQYLIAPCNGEVTDIYPNIGELVGTGTPIMSILQINDLWATFNVREELLSQLQNGKEIKVTIPALNNMETTMKVYYIHDLGSYAVWSATKSTGQYDSKTFEVKARPAQPIENLRAGMSVLLQK